jgi:Mor family transcriptional regulator
MAYMLENIGCVKVYAKGRIYSDIRPNNYDPYDSSGTRTQRNSIMLSQCAEGVSITTLTNQYGLPPQRVYQIIHII